MNILIDESKVHEWKDIYIEYARLHRNNKAEYRRALANAARVFNRKCDRNIMKISDALKEMELHRRHSIGAPQVMTERDEYMNPAHDLIIHENGGFTP